MENSEEVMKTFQVGLHGVEGEGEEAQENARKRGSTVENLEEVVKKLKKLSNPPSQQNDESVRRKRRAADGGGEVTEVTAKTKEQVSQ